jgi:hypothetical protein
MTRAPGRSPGRFAPPVQAGPHSHSLAWRWPALLRGRSVSGGQHLIQYRGPRRQQAQQAAQDVGSKDGLLDLVFDRLIGELAIPDPVPAACRRGSRSRAATC